MGDQQAAFVRNDFLELQANIATLGIEIKQGFIGEVPVCCFIFKTILGLLLFYAIAGVCTYTAKIAHSIGTKFLFSILAAYFYLLNFVPIYILYHNIKRRNKKKKLEAIL